MYYTFVKSVFIVGLVVLLAACSGPGQTVTTQDATDVEDGPIDLSDHEVFDASPYRDSPAQVDIVIQHDVPKELMESRADAGVTQDVRGYRVQVFMSLDRDEAVAAEESVRNWWSRQTVEERQEREMPESLNVYNLFRQPYYRIRVGDFRLRTDAERLMLLLLGRFSGASVVPDLVTIRR